MKSNLIYTEKKQLRKKIMIQSNALDKNYKKKSSKAITDFVLSTPNYKEAQTIFCFVGMENEVDTSAIIEDALAQGKRVAVPLVISKGVMEAKQIFSPEELSVCSYGIKEPSSSAMTIAPEEIELGIIPCLSCSHSGARLGYGGGFYDRYMQTTNFTRMCICYEKLTNEEIPMSRYDLRMDYLITEIGILSFVEEI